MSTRGPEAGLHPGSSTAACPRTGLFSVLAQAQRGEASPHISCLSDSHAARSHIHILPLVREAKVPPVLHVLAKLKVSLAETNPTPVKHWADDPFCS